MSVQLLDKTRKINKLLHNNNSSKVVFTDICEVLTEILASNVLVVSKKGKVLGVSTCEGVPEIHELLQDDRTDCLLQLMNFGPPFFRVIANVGGEAHGRRGFHSVDWKERQPRHVEYLPGKITIELLKCLTSQASLTAMAFYSA